ncbi:hypothetical protein HGRIS_011910 [Hohenbuehelia grisea]|uniref:Uncharacterized protein n=1 Tax=Hohenbuehelia grisea TaxID=104357 RepID=A0ABR3JWP6_9AGAR
MKPRGARQFVVGHAPNVRTAVAMILPNCFSILAGYMATSLESRIRQIARVTASDGTNRLLSEPGLSSLSCVSQPQSVSIADFNVMSRTFGIFATHRLPWNDTLN